METVFNFEGILGVAVGFFSSIVLKAKPKNREVVISNSINN